MLSVISYPLFVVTVILSLVLSISWFPVGWFEFR
ncbi:MAG: rod shape-determining protein MreD, partial [Marinobacter sp. 34-60-7]